MKRLLMILILGFGLAGILGAVSLVSLQTPDDIKKYSQNKALICFMSLDCDLGSYASDGFTQALYDLEGPNIGVYNINSFPYAIANGNSYDLGSTVIIVKNQIVASSKVGGPKGDEVSGNRALRNWLGAKLKELGIPFKMKVPGDSFVKPTPDNVSSVDLKKGNIAWFTFDDKNDKSAKKSSLIEPRDEPSGIQEGVYFFDGNYNKTGRSAARIENPGIQNAIGKNLSLSLNVRLESSLRSSYKWTSFFTLGYRAISLFWLEGDKFELQVEPQGTDSADTEKHLSWSDAYVYDDLGFTMDNWHNILLTFDYQKKRVKFYFDGVRKNDMVLSDEAIALLSKGNSWGPNIIGDFSNTGRGALLAGYADDCIVYDRVLNDAEASAIYRRDSKSNANVADEDLPPLPPGAVVDTDVRNTNSWSGGWETFWGSSGKLTTAMDLVVEGAKVSGTYNYKSGKLSGSVKRSGNDVIFSGTWTQSDSKGWFIFTLLPDGTKFQGSWGYDGKDVEAEGWSGYRRSVNFGRSGVRKN